ncbi:hypothetical protein BYT27DRAFT_7079612 [Phlegmacium glaucopus]|nr:hypothetical protein BYT27DRAFT_7079612 [Phlegmacium glaucopus]
MGKKEEVGLLDEGSEIVVIRRDLCDELGAVVNKNWRMTMQVVNNVKEGLKGCAEFLEIDVGGIKTYAHAFVVDSAPYRLLLGRPWQKGVKLGKIEGENGEVDVVITDLVDKDRKAVISTRERKEEQLKKGLAVMVDKSNEDLKIQGKDDSLTSAILGSSFTYDKEAHCLVYKKVANKVRPIATSMPNDVKIIRHFPEDPLASLPELMPHPPPFQPGIRLTQE